MAGSPLGPSASPPEAFKHCPALWHKHNAYGPMHDLNIVDALAIYRAARQWCRLSVLHSFIKELDMKTVEELGDTNNTIVCISSDHGELLGDHGDWAKSKPW